MTNTTTPGDETSENDGAPTTPAQRQYIETLFRTSYPNLVSYALCMRAATHEDAEDAVQHAFEKVLAGHRCLADPTEGAVLKYIYSMIDGVIKTAWRDNTVDHRHLTYNTRAVQAVAGPTPLPAPDSAVLLAELDAAARRRFDTLPERQRQVFILRLQDYSYRQIALLLGISESTVNGHMVRALAKMRDGLDDWLEDDPKRADDDTDTKHTDTDAADTVEDDT
ncbi:MAG TPA: sigma-70 family RNA polymerase sigma factor [Gemmatimonadaceae bacterium]|jgi:RNA polymerase sigma factor (sigma-70 family)|nr:sigma-70 family RNA polymerase sigma factor [Gemmatimonadaceae bacterium]